MHVKISHIKKLFWKVVKITWNYPQEKNLAISKYNSSISSQILDHHEGSRLFSFLSFAVVFEVQ